MSTHSNKPTKEQLVCKLTNNDNTLVHIRMTEENGKEYNKLLDKMFKYQLFKYWYY